MSTETNDNTTAISVVEKPFVSIAEYKQLLRQSCLMARKLKAMENIQDLLRQKDLELTKCKDMIQQYQRALRKSEQRQMDSVSVIARISEMKDRRGKEQTCDTEDESDVNKRFCLPSTDVNGKSLHDLDETTVASHVFDGSSTVVSNLPSVSTVLAASSYKDNHSIEASSAGDSMLEGTELQVSSAIDPPQKFQHDSETLLTEGACCQSTNLRDERKMDMISGSICSSCESRTDQNLSVQLPCVSSMSKDLLTKLMQQNARLKKALKDILSCRGTSVQHYLGRIELKDTIVQLRQRLAESTHQMAELMKKIKTYEDMEQTETEELKTNEDMEQIQTEEGRKEQ